MTDDVGGYIIKHMKKHILFSFVFVLSLILLGSYSIKPANAQVAFLPGCNATSNYSTTTGQPCGKTVSTPTLQIGAKGAAVVALQQTLTNSGLSVGKVDGVYGKQTAAAVSAYYKIHPCPLTSSTNQALTTCPPLPTPPTNPININTNSSPTISGVSGPQTLNVNQQGTWTVNASDPSNENLTFSVNWGGGNSACLNSDSCVLFKAVGMSQQYATITHTYSTAGTYTPTFTVTNASGLTAQASVSVSVTSSTNPNPPVPTSVITITSPAGGESWKLGETHTIQWNQSGAFSGISITLQNYTTNTTTSLVAEYCKWAHDNSRSKHIFLDDSYDQSGKCNQTHNYWLSNLCRLF